MPELPEVETIKRRLQERILNKTIAVVQVHHSKSFQGNSAVLINRKIVAITRQAKILQLKLNSNLTILVHLKMTGQLILQPVTGERIGGGHPTADWVANLPSSHTRVSIIFIDGDKLFFNDQRVFGWLKVVDRAGLNQEMAKYGKDINDPTLTVAELAAKLKKTRRPIKLALLDSALVAGLGNIYVCDTLNQAKISPFRLANSLNQAEVAQLLAAAQQVIARGIKLGGTTFDGKYVDVSGFAGQYQNQARVYGREGLICKNCGQPVLKVKQNGRGTYYCGNCQI